MASTAHPDPAAADPFGLADRGVLVTGATSVISLWTARLLLDLGARVVLTDRLDEEAIVATVREHARERGEPAIDVLDRVELVGSVDLRNRKRSEVPAAKAATMSSVEQLVEQARAVLGSIDVLINVAGGQEPVPAAALSTELFRRTVDRILLGTWNVIHEVFEQSMRDRGGRIVTMSADVAQGYPGMPAMGAARNGLEALHRALSVEWAPLGITCCVIAPGATDTPGLRRYPEAERVRALGIEASNLGRLLHPREVAWLFVTMASPWAAAVNGHTLVANGGDSNVTPVYQQMRKLWSGG